MKIEAGCIAVTINSTVLANLGKAVTVLGFIGEVDGFDGFDRWSVDSEVISSSGRIIYHQRESNLMRIDGGKFNDDRKSCQIKDKKVLI